MARIAGSRTLGEVRKAYTSKAAFNKAMRMDARDRLFETGVRNECRICGETRQVDICHIKAISDFNDDTKIENINGSHNNIVLCPLHHRLYDNHMVNLPDTNSINKGIHLIFSFSSENQRNEKMPLINDILLKALEECKILEGISVYKDE